MMTTSLIDTLGLKHQGLISIIGAGGKTTLMFRLARELADSGKTVLTTTTTKIFMPGPDTSPKTIIAGSIEELIKKSKSGLNRHSHFSAGSSHDPGSGKLNGFDPDIIDQLRQTNLFDWIIVEADGAKRKPMKATDTHEPVIPTATTHLVLVTGLDAVGLPLDENHVHRANLFSNNTGLCMGAAIDEHAIATSIAIEINKAGALGCPQVMIVFLNKADTPDRIDAGRKIGMLLQDKTQLDRIITAALKDNNPVKDCLPPSNKKKEKK
ncbi:selenium cofactor biosynthesis protein YqeC [Desulfobacula toluolica]|uniref:Conserved uncharacterized protein, CHP03172 n=1 Tax=Desulfobacula toluolica (strain DSM 7467 / Tol2) TaxID=651182 RepID=K0N6S4_DESTT|nr:selenium cofactor biosynthesis protein YqeC [Desulfobacula toluolica]CCK79684.1 conserved uncharacterized protein, CHP03172 [Desulfobacula toluolica Tol2]